MKDQAKNPTALRLQATRVQLYTARLKKFPEENNEVMVDVILSNSLIDTGLALLDCCPAPLCPSAVSASFNYNISFIKSDTLGKNESDINEQVKIFTAKKMRGKNARKNARGKLNGSPTTSRNIIGSGHNI